MAGRESISVMSRSKPTGPRSRITSAFCHALPRIVIVAARVEEHFRLFNEAVRSHDWTAFLATFTPDAVVRFDGVPLGPYVGLEQIACDMPEKQP
jgi:hypothetical protein